MINGLRARFLFDTGASSSFISQSFVKKNNIFQHAMATPQPIQLAATNTILTAKRSVQITIELGKYKCQMEAIVCEIKEYDIIIGMNWFRQEQPQIQWNDPRKLTINKNTKKEATIIGEVNEANTINVAKVDGKQSIMEISSLQLKRAIRRKDTELYLAFLQPKETTEKETTSVLDEKSKELQPSERELLQRYVNIFSEKLPEGLPPSRPNIDHKIEFNSDVTTPPSRPPYRLSYAELKELRIQLDKLLETGKIRPSKSPYGAPVLFTKKKNGTLRMCVDYRALNKLTIKNNYPLPRIDDLFDRLQGMKVYSKLDFTAGYHQCRIAEDDIPKTAFRTRYGHYEWVVIPFGLCNAPATFQKLMHEAFWDLLDKCVVIYLDDIIVFSKDREEHLRHLQQVFDIIKEHELYLQPAKCDFFVPRIEF